MIETYLTGKIRFRTERRGFFGAVLVLQVEVFRKSHDPDDSPAAQRGFKAWRDAGTEDLQALDITSELRP